MCAKHNIAEKRKVSVKIFAVLEAMIDSLGD
jgi:hypothetical protein